MEQSSPHGAGSRGVRGRGTDNLLYPSANVRDRIQAVISYGSLNSVKIQLLMGYVQILERNGFLWDAEHELPSDTTDGFSSDASRIRWLTCEAAQGIR